MKANCSAHRNTYHTASILEVGCRQLRRIDWSGRPIYIFMIAFRIGDPPADKELSSGAPAQSAAPLCEGCIASRLRRISICDAAASSPWTVDPPRGEPRFSWRRGVPPPKLYRSLGLAFRRGSSFIRVRLPLPYAIATGDFAERSIPSLLAPNKPPYWKS